MKSSITTKKYFNPLENSGNGVRGRTGGPLTGFTIIELIISIFILSIALVGIFSAFSIVAVLTSDAVDRLTATYLAQEGMEIVRNIRDTNWLNMDAGTPPYATWLDGLDICDRGCQADYAASTMFPQPGSGEYLKINSNGFYVYDSSNPNKTKFKRKITINCIPGNDCGTDYAISVSVQVSWDEKANIINLYGLSVDNCVVGSNCIIVEETLYDWYNYVPPR
jgi:hypothetical protein